MCQMTPELEISPHLYSWRRSAQYLFTLNETRMCIWVWTEGRRHHTRTREQMGVQALENAAAEVWRNSMAFVSLPTSGDGFAQWWRRGCQDKTLKGSLLQWL